MERPWGYCRIVIFLQVNTSEKRKNTEPPPVTPRVTRCFGTRFLKRPTSSMCRTGPSWIHVKTSLLRPKLFSNMFLLRLSMPGISRFSVHLSSSATCAPWLRDSYFTQHPEIHRSDRRFDQVRHILAAIGFHAAKNYHCDSILCQWSDNHQSIDILFDSTYIVVNQSFQPHSMSLQRQRPGGALFGKGPKQVTARKVSSPRCAQSVEGGISHFFGRGLLQRGLGRQAEGPRLAALGPGKPLGVEEVDGGLGGSLGGLACLALDG